jgi:hypothetical protein
MVESADAMSGVQQTEAPLSGGAHTSLAVPVALGLVDAVREAVELSDEVAEGVCIARHGRVVTGDTGKGCEERHVTAGSRHPDGAMARIWGPLWPVQQHIRAKPCLQACSSSGAGV